VLKACACVVVAVVLLGVGGVAGYRVLTRVVAIEIASQAGGTTRGTLVHAEQYAYYPGALVRGVVALASLPERVPVEAGVTLYRVRYWTAHRDGAPTIASGLVAIPDSSPARGVVSYHHGTNTYRHGAPSAPGIGEGAFVSAVFAGGGYIVVAADYIGLGTNTDVHPYYVTESTTNAVIDLLRAAHALTAQLGVAWPGRLYLTGFSQGGHTTMATHRALESLGDPTLAVAASAAIAGPFDLAKFSVPRALGGASPSDALYLAYLAIAYAHAYKQPITSLLREPYATTLPVLFDGEHDNEDILAGLPATPRAMFVPEFLEDFDAGRPSWFYDALVENGAIQWPAKAPIRLYYGENDVDVSPKEAEFAEAALAAQGAAVKRISVGPRDHGETILHAAPNVRLWFDEISGGATQ